MSREAIEVDAFTWRRIRRLYEPDVPPASVARVIGSRLQTRAHKQRD